METMASLDEAIAEARPAIHGSTGTPNEIAKHLQQLSSLLKDRYINTGSVSDLDESIRIARQAVDVTTDDDSE
jgi:hypothetical protein